MLQSASSFLDIKNEILKDFDLRIGIEMVEFAP
jgi:hypothetical protein